MLKIVINCENHDNGVLVVGIWAGYLMVKLENGLDTRVWKSWRLRKWYKWCTLLPNKKNHNYAIFTIKKISQWVSQLILQPAAHTIFIMLNFFSTGAQPSLPLAAYTICTIFTITLQLAAYSTFTISTLLSISTISYRVPSSYSKDQRTSFLI